MGWTFGKMSRASSVTSLGIPIMSEGFHEKISRLSHRQSTSAHSYLSIKPALIQTVLLVSS
jgi:hypothetical protein